MGYLVRKGREERLIYEKIGKTDEIYFCKDNCVNNVLIESHGLFDLNGKFSLTNALRYSNTEFIKSNNMREHFYSFLDKPV